MDRNNRSEDGVKSDSADKFDCARQGDAFERNRADEFDFNMRGCDGVQ